MSEITINVLVGNETQSLRMTANEWHAVQDGVFFS